MKYKTKNQKAYDAQRETSQRRTKRGKEWKSGRVGEGGKERKVC